MARRLAWEFLDGDDFHPEENRRKMASGVALQDEDRGPWLERLGEELVVRERVVLACSALKRSYRDRLRALAGRVDFVMLVVPEDVIRKRLEARSGHFFPAGLLASQWADLETGDDLVEVSNGGEPESCVGEVLDLIRARGGG